MLDNKQTTDFLNNCGITLKSVEDLWYTAEELYTIYIHYQSKIPEYEKLWTYIVQNFLQESKKFHSIKLRVKASKDLIEKIIRKSYRWLSVWNYEEKITDLIWVRVLLLDKVGWEKIHDFIEGRWRLKEKIAFWGNADEINVYKEKKFKIEGYPSWYRSLHYIIETQPTIQKFYIEVQVRSLLEEVWCEVDHLLKYKKTMKEDKKPVINSWLNVLNGLISKWNDIVSFLCKLDQEKLYVRDLIKIRKIIEDSSLSKEEKEKCYNEINQFNSIWTYITTDITNMTSNIQKVFAWFNQNQTALSQITTKLMADQIKVKQAFEGITKPIIEWQKHNEELSEKLHKGFQKMINWVNWNKKS